MLLRASVSENSGMRRLFKCKTELQTNRKCYVYELSAPSHHRSFRRGDPCLRRREVLSTTTRSTWKLATLTCERLFRALRTQR